MKLKRSAAMSTTCGFGLTRGAARPAAPTRPGTKTTAQSRQQCVNERETSEPPSQTDVQRVVRPDHGAPVPHRRVVELHGDVRVGPVGEPDHERIAIEGLERQVTRRACGTACRSSRSARTARRRRTRRPRSRGTRPRRRSRAARSPRSGRRRPRGRARRSDRRRCRSWCARTGRAAPGDRASSARRLRRRDRHLESRPELEAGVARPETGAHGQAANAGVLQAAGHGWTADVGVGSLLPAVADAFLGA